MAANSPQLGRVLGKAHTSLCSQGRLKPEAILRRQETRSPVWTRNLLPNPFSSDNGAAKKDFHRKQLSFLGCLLLARMENVLLHAEGGLSGSHADLGSLPVS